MSLADLSAQLPELRLDIVTVYLALTRPPAPPPPDYLPATPTLTERPGSSPPATVPTAETTIWSQAPVIPQEAAPPAPVPAEPATRPEQRRVTLTGRVGRAPRFDTTPRGDPRAVFPLATHPTPETTEWVRVVAVRERAEKLRALTKGAEIEVIGYQQTKHRRTKDGQLTPYQEVTVVVVRTPKPPTTP